MQDPWSLTLPSLPDLSPRRNSISDSFFLPARVQLLDESLQIFSQRILGSLGGASKKLRVVNFVPSLSTQSFQRILSTLFEELWKCGQLPFFHTSSLCEHATYIEGNLGGLSSTI